MSCRTGTTNSNRYFYSRHATVLRNNFVGEETPLIVFKDDRSSRFEQHKLKFLSPPIPLCFHPPLTIFFLLNVTQNSLHGYLTSKIHLGSIRCTVSIMFDGIAYQLSQRKERKVAMLQIFFEQCKMPKLTSRTSNHVSS